MNKVLLLITTESNKKFAKTIAKLLLKNKLAACVSINKIFSTYKWKNKIEKIKEFEIIIKSKPELKDDLISFLQKNTSYNVPQILYRKFDTESKYYNWIKM